MASLSHELRTPLTPVLLTIAILNRDPSLTPQMREKLELIRRNIRAEIYLIDDMLDVTRIATGKLQVTKAPMDVHEAVRGALEVCNPDIRARRQQLTLALDARNSRIEGDINRVQQAVWNVLKNASKFTPEE